MEREKSREQGDSCRKPQRRSGTWKGAFCTSLVGDFPTGKSGNRGREKVTPGLKRCSYRQKDRDFVFPYIVHKIIFHTCRVLLLGLSC